MDVLIAPPMVVSVWHGWAVADPALKQRSPFPSPSTSGPWNTCLAFCLNTGRAGFHLPSLVPRRGSPSSPPVSCASYLWFLVIFTFRFLKRPSETNGKICLIRNRVEGPLLIESTLSVLDRTTYCLLYSDFVAVVSGLWELLTFEEIRICAGLDPRVGTLGGNITTSKLIVDSKTRLTCTLDSSDTAILGHRWTKGDKVLQEDSEPGLTTQYECVRPMEAPKPRVPLGLAGEGVDTHESAGQYFCTFLSEPTGKTADLTVEGPPRIKAVKKSEHATEGETVVLACKSESFPPVTDWLWYKINDNEVQIFSNASQNKVVMSSETKTELHIQNLDLEADPGKYACNGTNAMGTDQAVITLRVRNRLAALWPFLGIVAEVLVLVTIIFIYEKRRKPDEVLDVPAAQEPPLTPVLLLHMTWLRVCTDEDTGSAPLKSSGHMNDKDKNVRQRNAN
ncbi:Basigin [Myotis davidii]|uniref:Basigin n=1 Tax=Myotis davidii TaxID=225400 RepID=L5LTM1_MYODS|nr:Basigin [Myotis davidii]